MNMNSFNNKIMDRFFRKVDGVVWDLFTGKIGVQTEDGITTIEGSGDEAQITVNMFDQFGMAVPAFAQSTPVDAVAVGDLIYTNGKPKGWVTSINEKPATEDKPAIKKFNLMTPTGTTTNWTPPKLSMLGFDSGIMVLRSLMNMLPGGKEGLGSMQNMLMPMLMIGDGNVDMESVMPMVLFSQLGSNGEGTDNAGMNNMMQTMLMMQMMKGGSSKGFFE